MLRAYSVIILLAMFLKSDFLLAAPSILSNSLHERQNLDKTNELVRDLEDLAAFEQRTFFLLQEIEAQLKHETNLSMASVLKFRQTIVDWFRLYQKIERPLLKEGHAGETFHQTIGWSFSMNLQKFAMHRSSKLRQFWRDQMLDRSEGMRAFAQWKWWIQTPMMTQRIEKNIEQLNLEVLEQENPNDPVVSWLLEQDLVAKNYLNLKAHKLQKKYVPFKMAVSDFFFDSWREGSQIVSGTYGNVVGKIKWRTGFLMENQEAIQVIKETLRPLDIIINKTGNKLTDKNIPGHFGHVAVYLGDEKQLRDLGVWQQDWFAPYRARIKRGQTILEMTRKGMNLADVPETLEADEVAILRLNKTILDFSNQNEIIETMRQGIQQFGKEYDFNFDRNLTSRITCAELLLPMFPNLPLDSERILGRSSVSPDNVAAILHHGYAEGIIHIIGNSGGIKILKGNEASDSLKKITATSRDGE